jgi:hemin uptake protein HemP
MSKLNFVHSSDLTSSTLMRFLLSVQVLPRIEEILSSHALLMGTERIFAKHRTVLYLISHEVCNVQCYHITE